MSNPEIAKEPEKVEESPEVDPDEEVVETMKTAVEEKGKRWINNQKVMFTYKYHHDKKMLQAFIEEKIGRKCKWFRAAHETSDKKCPYEHTHATVDFGKILQTQNCRLFDIVHNGENVHPNVQFIVDPRRWRYAVQYLSKQDPDNADLKKRETNVEGIWEYPNVQEMLVGVGSIKLANQLIAIYNLKPRQNSTIRRHLRGWQLDLEKEMNGDGGDRKIIWICDQKGGAGKTYFQKYMLDKYPNDFHCAPGQSVRDGATNIDNALRGGWTGKMFVLNMSRSHEERTGVYDFIEQVRDGLMAAVKYQSRTLTFECTHLVVMANWFPILNSLSLDRWDIREIREGHMVGLTLEESHHLCLARKGPKLMVINR